MQKPDLFELTESTDRISEDYLPEVLAAYESHALNLISQKEIQEALIHLKKSESIMEAATAQGYQISSTKIVSLLNNIAYCYQELHCQKKAENYADACFFNSRSSDFQPKFIQSPELSIKSLKFISKLSLQYNFLLFKTDPKKSSEILQISEKIGGLCIKQTYKACQKQVAQLKSALNLKPANKKSDKKGILYKRALPVLEELNSFIEKKVMKKLKMRSALGLQCAPDWVSKLSFDGFFEFLPVSCCFFEKTVGIQEEITKDSILEKVFLYLASLYYAAVNFRILSQPVEALKYARYAQEIAENFFNTDSVVYEQIAGEIKNIEGLKARASRMKIRKNLSFAGKIKNKENLTKESKTKAAYSNYKQNIQRIMSAGKIKKHRSESCELFKEIKQSISFKKVKSQLD